ncbi:hypothetical protein AB205_0090570, partial [Aquarana catesbeiana]
MVEAAKGVEEKYFPNLKDLIAYYENSNKGLMHSLSCPVNKNEAEETQIQLKGSIKRILLLGDTYAVSYLPRWMQHQSNAASVPHRLCTENRVIQHRRWLVSCSSPSGELLTVNQLPSAELWRGRGAAVSGSQ